MSKTLLEMVTDILNDMDSDPVNSIDDTEEAGQVAQIIRTTCEELLSSRNWEDQKDIVNLEGLADTANPTKMRIPDSLVEIEWVKYNKKDITYLSPYQFKTLLFNREELTGVVNASGYMLNKDPTYYTSYDGVYVYFDSYNLSDEATLQSSKAVAFGPKSLSWNMIDAFVPDIPEKMFVTLLAEAKAVAFVALKQQANMKAETQAKRGRTRLQSQNFRIKQARTTTNGKINYGRK